MRPYGVRDADWFFGRETDLANLVERLRRKRFVALAGDSACGKSSLLHAGLIPALERGEPGPAGPRPRIVELLPGAADIRGYLERGLDALAKPAGARDDDHVLVIVDQFEELLRFSEDAAATPEPDSVAFVEQLLALARSDRAVTVVIALRADFAGDCARFAGLAEAVDDGLFVVPRMTREEMRRAVEGPVERAGAQVAPALVARLLDDASGEADALPMLQHAMLRTWTEWKKSHLPGAPLDVAQYEAIGGLHGAVSQHANELYDELDPRLALVAERLFRTVTGRDDENRDVRRPAAFGALREKTGAYPGDLERLLRIYTAPAVAFLTATGPASKDDAVVGVVHESLMRLWDRLARWTAETAAPGAASRAVGAPAPESRMGLTALATAAVLVLVAVLSVAAALTNRAAQQAHISPRADNRITVIAPAQRTTAIARAQRPTAIPQAQRPSAIAKAQRPTPNAAAHRPPSIAHSAAPAAQPAATAAPRAAAQRAAAAKRRAIQARVAAEAQRRKQDDLARKAAAAPKRATQRLAAVPAGRTQPTATRNPSHRPAPATPQPRATPAARAPDEACALALRYETKAANDAISRQEAYDAAVAGLATNLDCGDHVSRVVNDAYLLSMRAPAEAQLHIGNWRFDLQRADERLRECATLPELRGTPAAANCNAQLANNERVRRQLTALTATPRADSHAAAAPLLAPGGSAGARGEKRAPQGHVAESADALDLGSSGATRPSSTLGVPKRAPTTEASVLDASPAGPVHSEGSCRGPRNVVRPVSRK